MKRNHRLRKPQKTTFQTYRDPKANNNTHSIEEKVVSAALNSIEKISVQQQFARPRAKSFKQNKNSSANLNVAINYSFMDLGKEMKSKRSLIDENNQLKKKLESLGSMKVSKQQLNNKRISAEFEKQMYWNGPQTHLISGVKTQYQKMKESYLKKCDDYEELLKSVAVSSTIQFMSYIQALELQNHILARKMETKNKSLQKKNNEELQELTNIVLKDHNQKFDSRLKKWKEKLRSERKLNKQLKSKIMFLERLLIEKDNNEHSSKRNAKKSEKEKGQLQIMFKNLELQLKNTNLQYSKTIQSLKINHNQLLNQEKQGQVSFQKQQQQIIIRLQKENKYLHSLVQSWKEEKNPKKDIKKQISTAKSKINKSHHNSAEPSLEATIHTIKKSQKHQGPFVYLQKEESQTESLIHQNLRRIPYTCNNKNSENSVKNRIVQPHQIQQSIQYARCILISKGLNIDWIVQQFQGDQDEWSKQYINLQQAREICAKNLQLNKVQSQMIARYLIQHSSKEHVYTDDINEYDRTIVKSIVRNLFGCYSVYEKEKEQFEQTLAEWKGKLQWTLENTTKGGVVSREKFSDLLQSLNLNFPGFVLYCVSKMALHSQSLQKLRFIHLFAQLKKE